MLADSHPKGAVAHAYDVHQAHEGSSRRALFVVDGRGIVRWSRAYPCPVNPGVDGILCALESVGALEDPRPGKPARAARPATEPIADQADVQHPTGGEDAGA